MWRGDTLLYAGMAGRNGRGSLADRLRSHWSGRRSGDQFCVYVGDRFVVPTLTAQQLEAVGTGELSLDGLVREVVRAELSYRFVAAATAAEALAVERHVQRHGLEGRQPLLNPIT